MVKDRFDRLLKLVQSIATTQCSRDTGKTLEVLVEEVNEKDPSMYQDVSAITQWFILREIVH